MLRCFTGDTPLLGIGELAKMTGLSKASAHRYAITMVELGYLEQPPLGSRKYRLGLRVSDLGMSVLNVQLLRTHGHVFLEKLRRQTSYTVSTAVLDNDEVRIIDCLPGFCGHAQLLPLKVGLGCRLPAHCTSIGKVLLANLQETERTKALARLKLSRKTPNTITHNRLLSQELEHIREVGFAVSHEEYATGVHAIAMPILSDGAAVAAVAVVAPTSMVSGEELTIVFGSPLLATASAFSALFDQQGKAKAS